MSFLRRLPLLVPVLMLTSCVAKTVPPRPSIPLLTPLPTPAPTPTSAIDPLCPQIRIVALSRLDTTGTKTQVEANNAVLGAVCSR